MANRSIGVDMHWGELPSREMHKQEVITPDIIENIWRQVLDDTTGTECDYQSDQQSEFIQLPMGEPHVLNTVNLHHQLRSMENGSMLREISEIDTKEFGIVKKPISLFNFAYPKPLKNESRKTSTVHHLRTSTTRSLLRHSAIILVAHIGYENATDIAIDTITDVTDDFLKRISILLKVASEQKNDGFPDAMERVLVETGVGGVAGIHEYYQNYVLKFEQKMKRKVEIMIENQQRQLELNSAAKKEFDDAVSKLQFDELDAFGNVYSREVPTLQLLDPDMGFPPSLDAGFQMLHSLEQDELNSLEVEEDDNNVNDSPSGQHTDKKKEKRMLNN